MRWRAIQEIVQAIFSRGGGQNADFVRAFFWMLVFPILFSIGTVIVVRLLIRKFGKWPLPPTDETPVHSQRGVPRLSLQHLFLWVTCTALCLAVNQALNQASRAGLSPTTETLPTKFVILGAVFEMWFGISCGTALTGLLMWIRWRWQGLSFPWYPGDYYLCGLSIIISLAFFKKLVLVAASHRYDDQRWWDVLLGLISMTIYWVAESQVSARRWRWFLMACGIIAFVVDFDHLTRMPIPYFAELPWLLEIALVWVVIIDSRQTHSFAWTHWLGVFLGFIWLMPPIIDLIFKLLFSSGLVS